MQSVCALLLWMNMVAALFFHEKSSIVLAPAGDKSNISFGYSLGFQRGDHPSLVIGAPLYDTTGRVYRRSIQEILNGTTSCDPLDIDFAALSIAYDRNLSLDQNFYLGASIAATEKFFVTCAPLRTAYGESQYKNKTRYPKFGAYGACVIYDQNNTAHACQGYGLENFMKQGKIVTYALYGGSGWSTMVDEAKQKIFISKSFNIHDMWYGTMDPKEKYKSLKIENKANWKTSKDVINYGKAMSFGNYFEENVKKTHYAFSSRDMNGRGAIDFYSSNNKWNKLEHRYEDTSIGSMFGAALSSADVTRDKMADLLVGAPAQVTDARCYDRGAVHVLTKLKSANSKIMVSKLTIWGVKDGGRFGTTLSINDVDGDSYPEIFISAPFEKSEKSVGALYILCGHGIYTLLKRDIKVAHVSELERTQRIEMETHQSFGFSLQPVADFNDNGSDELGVGAPESSRVTLLLGVRAVTVKVTSRFPNTVSHSDSASSFADYLSCVKVDLPSKPEIITMKLSVKNVIIGKGALNNSEDAMYELDLATENGTKIDEKWTEYCKLIRIVNASTYIMNTTVSAVENIEENGALEPCSDIYEYTDSSDISDGDCTYKTGCCEISGNDHLPVLYVSLHGYPISKPKFKSSWVTFSVHSNLTKSTRFECRCLKKEDCEPDLHAELQWSGSTHTNGRVTYVVGSSQMETANVIVRNTGTKGCGGCAVVTVSGQLYHLPCEASDARQYKCELPSSFNGNTSENFEIQLSMGTLSNQENNLTIDVEVRKNCDKPEPKETTSLTVLYNFTRVLDNLILNGTSMDGEITDTDIHDESTEVILREQTYTISNNQPFTWKNIGVNVSASNKPYIESIKVTIKHTGIYNEYNGTDDYFWRSTLTIVPYSSIKITVCTTLLKRKLALHFQDGQNITLPSELALDLLPDHMKSTQLTTVLTYKKEMTIWHNKMLITIIALVVALLVLIIITVILYKNKFFVRKNKEKLKKEIRRRSIRRESSRRRPSNTFEEGARAQPSEAEDLVMKEQSSPPCDSQLDAASSTVVPPAAPAQNEGTTRTYYFE